MELPNTHIRRARRLVPTGTLLLALALIAVWFGFNATKLRAIYEESQRLRREDDLLRREERLVAQLEQERHRLQTSDFESEKRLRERLKMLKPGERMMIIRPPETE